MKKGLLTSAYTNLFLSIYEKRESWYECWIERPDKDDAEEEQGNFVVAQELCERGHYNDSASRMYYAVFHSLQAILLTKNLTYSKHSQLIGAFNKEFVRPGIFSKEFNKWIEKLFLDRQTGDYGYTEVLPREEVKEDLERAEAIISSVEAYLSQGNFLS